MSKDYIPYIYGGVVYELTEKEIILMDVMVDPKNNLLDIAAMCNIVGMTTKEYYESLQNPDLTTLVRVITENIIKSRLPQVASQTLMFAMMPKNSADRKTLLTIGGAYSQQINITKKEEVKHTVSIANELLEKLAELGNNRQASIKGNTVGEVVEGIINE